MVDGVHPTLRMFGYDYVLSIEHEDSLMSRMKVSRSRVVPDNIMIKESVGQACGSNI